MRRVALLCGVLLTGACATSGARADPDIAVQTPTLSLKHAGLYEMATQGTFCVTPPPGGGSGLCADFAYPLPVAGRLPVRPGGRVVLRSSVEATSVIARLLRVDGSTIKPVATSLRVSQLSAKRWAVKLPRRLRHANVLDAFIRWDNAIDGRGDADYWGGIRRDCG